MYGLRLASIYAGFLLLRFKRKARENSLLYRRLAFAQSARSIVRLAPSAGAAVQHVVQVQQCASAVQCASESYVVTLGVAPSQHDGRAIHSDLELVAIDAFEYKAGVADESSARVWIDHYRDGEWFGTWTVRCESTRPRSLQGCGGTLTRDHRDALVTSVSAGGVNQAYGRN